jgi:hypothetical protein
MVPSAFGNVDAKFALHPNDEERAKEAIRIAKSEGASFDDFEKEIVWHCYKKVTASGALQSHINEQVSKAKRMWRT